MPNYDFLNLSPPEFEDLSRDILQKQLAVTLESFTTGRDKGIDLRRSYTKDNQLIVQCKRYKEYNNLWEELKREKIKVEKLKPKRYILATSVGLTPAQKDNIYELFQPYICDYADIYGKDDLNNLLLIYPEIERQNFKLWLSSVNILEKILNSRVINQSTFEKKNIQDAVKIYVKNKSYDNAINIIKDKKYVVISGIPGIGKTTLARILVYHYLANGFEEFVFLTDSINDGTGIFKEGVKQVFLFDDFLGTNFLGDKLATNEERKIVDIIKQVNKSDDKILILTTREYVLKQAQQQYDLFDSPILEFAKCIVDIAHYTNLSKAKILYNHLYFSSITEKYIENLLLNEQYKKIIEHPNYNPRIIETITSDNFWKYINPSEFANKFYEFLDYPERIWKKAYENQISNLSRCILAVLLTTGVPIIIEDLRYALQSFAKKYSTKYGILYSEPEFKKSIKELEGTFIRSNKDDANQFVIQYQNPSVQDFLVNYFKEQSDYIKDLIETAVYFNQLFGVFIIKEVQGGSGNAQDEVNKIVIQDELRALILSRLLSDFDNLKYSALRRVGTPSGSLLWMRQKDSTYGKLDQITREIHLENYQDLRMFVAKKYKENVEPYNFEYDDMSHYMNLLMKFKDEIEADKMEIMNEIIANIHSVDQMDQFERLEDIFPDEFESFIRDNDDLHDYIYDLMKKEVDNADSDNLQTSLDQIQLLSMKFSIDASNLEGILEEKIDEIKAKETPYDWEDDRDYREEISPYQHEQLVIKEMFDGLRYKE